MNTLFRWIIVPAMLLYAGYSFWQDRLERQDSQSWPTTKGYLIEAHVVQVQDSTTDNANNRLSTDHYYFAIEIQYDYNIEGNWYRGNRAQIGEQRFSNERDATVLLNQLKSEKTLVVYFNPKNPAKSTLSR